MGRSTSQSFSVGRNSGNGRINPPSCDANTYIYNNGDGTASFGWAGNCPSVSPDSGYYCIYSTSDPSASSINTCGVYRNGGPYRTGIRSKVPGDWNGYRANQTFCLGIRASAGVWGQQVDHNKCMPVDPPHIDIPASFANGFGGQSNIYFWYPAGSGTCHDGYHNWIACISWRAHQINGYVSACTVNGASERYYGPIPPNTFRNDSKDETFINYNKTFGWKWDGNRLNGYPGQVTLQITCYSGTFGNQDTVEKSAYGDQDKLPVPDPPPPPPTKPGGGSGGGGTSGCGRCCALNTNQVFYPGFSIIYIPFYFGRAMPC